MSPASFDALGYVCRDPKLALGATDRHMTGMAVGNAMSNHLVTVAFIAISAVGAGAALAADEVEPRPEVDRLIEQFNAGARQTDGSVRLDAWIESGRESDALVVVVEPRGEFKLVANPGITVTPTHEQPLEVLVEYAYCVVEYQCFFGEEVLTVAARYD
jgi:hypothetical protein